MPRLLNESGEGLAGQQYPLRGVVTTIGRRGFNDVVIGHRTISGEHALVRREGDCYFIEDLNSTNGTFVNGQFVKRHLLEHNDTIELGGCVLRFMTDDVAPTAHAAAAATHVADPGPPTANATLPQTLDPQPAMIKVLTGEAAGRELVLTKVVTTVGKPGVQLASISRRPAGFILTHLQGQARPSVNGVAMPQDVVVIRGGDVIELSGTQMRLVCD